MFAPIAVKVAVCCPRQIVAEFTLTTGEGFTNTVTVAQPAGVTHDPSPLTKYVVVNIGETVIPIPAPTKFCPQEPVYQYQFTASFKVPVAVSVAVLPAQIVALLTVGIVGSTH